MEECAESGYVTVRNGQDRRALPDGLVERLAKGGDTVLDLVAARDLALIEPPPVVDVTLVDDGDIARVHGEFLDDPTPTDVITFPYDEQGEIVISVETAERQAGEFGSSLEREVALYLVHGILHLCGYEDSQESDRIRMETLQESLLGEVFGSPGKA